MRDVFIRSGIFIAICVSVSTIFWISIFDNVCTLCAVVKARSIAHFLDNCSKDKSLFGYFFESSSKTIDVSQVTSYLGVGGLSLNTPLKKRLILSSFDT